MTYARIGFDNTNQIKIPQKHIELEKTIISSKEVENTPLVVSSLLSLSTLGVTLLALKNKNIKTNLSKIKLNLDEAAWFKEYKKLCNEFGVKIREIGEIGGAADHYEELLLKKTNPEEYVRYLKDRKLKANLNETKAKILEELDKL